MSAPGVPAQPTEPTEPAQPTETAQPAGPVRQSLVLVLPTTAEYDSRTYRIASSAAARGHDVTVLARLAPGLATDERHPAGYRIRRVPVSAVSGLPLPASMIRRLERRQARRRRERVASTGLAAAQTDPPGESPAPAADAGRGTGGIVRRTVGAVWRIAAIALTVRSQTRASRAVDPAADLYHGMAYMGVPIALDLGRRHQAPVVYDARDIYLEARNLARLPWPARRSFGWAERRWARRAARVMTVNRAIRGRDAGTLRGRAARGDELLVSA